MAGCAVVVKIILHMIWIGSAGKIALMASVTIPGKSAHLIVDMAGIAQNLPVGTGEFKSRSLKMVELGRLPVLGVVTRCTIGGKTKHFMVRFGCLVVILQMAAVTLCRSARIGLGMAANAIYPDMCSLQHKT